MDDCDRCCHPPRGLATGTHCLSFRHDRLIDRLQALRVVLVGLLAGGSAGAGGRASVADSLRCQSVCAVGKKSWIIKGKIMEAACYDAQGVL